MVHKILILVSAQGPLVLVLRLRVWGQGLTIAGGYMYHPNYDILEYNPEEDTILTIGQMTQARYEHAVSVVQAQDFSVWCK